MILRKAGHRTFGQAHRAAKNAFPLKTKDVTHFSLAVYRRGELSALELRRIRIFVSDTTTKQAFQPSASWLRKS